MFNSVLFCEEFDNTIRWTENERLEYLFEHRCDRMPSDRLAVVTEDVALTFHDLDNRANQTARYLLDQGLKAGDRIGLLFDNSIHPYVALLAVLKIGAAYVPFDASFPTERIGFILGDADIKAIISVSRFRPKLADFTVKQVFLDSAERQITEKSMARLSDHEKGALSDQLFYIIYTSGTTGKPKGVAIDHAGICNFVKVAGEVYGIREDDRCYQGMTLAFDFHVESLWVPLIAGATLIAGKPGSTLFGNDLHEFLLKQRVTVLPCVPTLWATLEQDLPDVRIVLLSGESVPHNLVVRWHRPDRSILNAYGPTECSVSSTLRRLIPDSPVTIGRPLPTYTTVILDEHRDEVVADGAIGEIGIAGIGLAVGYLNRDDLTKQKFIPDFLNLPNNPSKRIYRTGDYGRIRDDGELEFHGRIDTQVKIRGYRVELGEIESVLLQLPQISQVVVNPHESEPGAVELVAYYTRKQGALEVSPNEISETLRRHLPAYMVPAYLEELPLIPMTVNNKADRKNLPAPKGPRFSVSSSKFVAPRTEVERILADALTTIMKIERVSVEDNFFQDLGAHSLLMARFSAELRKKLDISTVSMRDIYLNPTIEKLARYLESLPQEASGQPQRMSNREQFHIPSDLSYYGCGALQFASYVVWSVAAIWLLVAGIDWSYNALPDLGESYLRVVVFVVGVSLLFSAIPIAAKWLLIGKWKQEAIPIWSLRYFRFWFVKTLVGSAPMAQFGDPFYNLYLRLLGAKIGANTVIRSRRRPVCTDLISIGANTILSKDSIVSGYRAQSNFIQTGPVHIGANAFVGEASVLDINTTMEDDTQLGYASSLHDGQRVPQGKHYHGCPAQETTANYWTVEPRVCTPLRRWTYAIVQLMVGYALMPVPILILYSLFPYTHDFVGLHEFSYETPVQSLLILTDDILIVSFAVFFASVVFGLLAIGTIPRVLNLMLRQDTSYVLYGVHYFVQEWIVRLSNSVFYNRLFGDSSAIVYYKRWVGWNLNKIIQTGSNFGMTQRHDNPFLCDIGSGTMVSGGLKMMNETMSTTAFKLGMVKVGDHNYLGNYVHIPPESKMGTNVLLATKALTPIDGPVRENTGLLGSPCFEIPRATERDKRMSKMDDATWRQRLRAKNRYNLVTAILYLLNNWFSFFAVTLCMTVGFVYYSRYGVGSIVTAAAAAFFVSVFWFWFVERLVLGFGRLAPKVVSMLLDDYFWFHERYWKLNGLWRVAPLFVGTPFKNVISRLQGVRLGRKVFDDGGDYDEDTLVEIGDYTNVNAGCVIQPHSLEEGVFKSDYVKIGRGCTLGVLSNVHYGVVMGDYVVLSPDSFLMKGEIVDSDTTWRGNPATSVGDRAIRDTDHQISQAADHQMSQAFVPAEVA
jgi:non-ribosomal peptide synthetase-like protein